jgi:hypothetical protein
MSSRVAVFVVAGLSALVSPGCDGSSGGASAEGTKKTTFYVEGMGEKLKLL